MPPQPPQGMPPQPGMPPQAGMPPQPGMPPQAPPPQAGLTPAELAQQKGGKKGKAKKERKKREKKPKAPKAAKAKGAKTPASEADKKKYMTIGLVVVLVLAVGYLVYTMFLSNPTPAPKPPATQANKLKKAKPATGAKSAEEAAKQNMEMAQQANEQEEKAGEEAQDSANSQLISEDDLKSLDSADKKEAAPSLLQETQDAEEAPEPAVGIDTRGRFEDSVSLDDTAFAFAGIGAASPGQAMAMDMPEDTEEEQDTSKKPEDTYDSSYDSNAYAYSGTTSSKRRSRTKKAKQTYTQTYDDAEYVEYNEADLPETEFAPYQDDYYGGRQSYDLYSWTNQGTHVGRNLTSTPDVFDGPGRLSSPGGGLSEYSEMHKVVVHESTSRMAAEQAANDLAYKRNLQPEINTKEVAGEVYYKVTVGHYADKKVAENMANEIKSKGYNTRLETERNYQN